MNRKLGKMLSLVLAVLMIFTVVPMSSFATEDSTVYLEIAGKSETYDPDNMPEIDRFSFFGDAVSEFDGCFGNQLSGEAELFYDAIVDYYVNQNGADNYTYVLSTPLSCDVQYVKATETSDAYLLDNEDGDLDTYHLVISNVIFDAQDAFLKDYPESFWFGNASFTYSYSLSVDISDYYDSTKDVIDATATIKQVTFKPVAIYENSVDDLSEFNEAVDSLVDEFIVYFSANSVESRKDMLKYIHDYICNNSEYDWDSLEDSSDLAAHSPQPFFIGDKKHVCEGYAKTLKIICDRLEIPCVLVSGNTRDNEYPDDATKEGDHMWNYVQMDDGDWYLVDITWDDQSVIYDTYFLAGWKSEGFYFETIEAERYEEYSFSKFTVDGVTYNGKSFIYPELSDVSFDSHDYVPVVTEPDCEKVGFTTYTCSICGNCYVTDYADTTDHSYTSEVTTPATHLTEGVETFTCSGCGDTYTEAVAKLEAHTYEAKVIAPTCTEDGYTTYTCACGESYTDDETTALGHAFTWVVDSEATCGEDGSKHEKCSRCNETRSPGTVIQATGKHSYTSAITTPATHLTEGVETFTCSGCGDTYTEAVAKLEGHTYSSVVTAPTCTDDGYTTYTCACGDTYTDDETTALGHAFTWVVDSEATCGEDGSKHEKCSRCNETRSHGTVIQATGKHSYTSAITTPATHTTEGVETFTCACGDSYTETIEKLTGHSYSENVIKAATHLEEGTMLYTCACGDSYTADIAKLPEHTYTTEITKAATHLEKGTMTYTCECGDEYTADIAKLPEHNYVAAGTTAADCEHKGYTTYKCECGGEKKDNYINALGHDYEDGICTRCGDNKVDNCSCNCHKSGFSGIIWKILCFLYKLFKTNKVCDCGVAHY